MSFLALDLSVVLPAALLGTALALVVIALAFLVASALGYRFLWRKKKFPRRDRTVAASAAKEAPLESTLSEEELIVIITAAVEAVGAASHKRVRVVSFKRV